MPVWLVKPDVLRPGIAGMRESMVIRLRPWVTWVHPPPGRRVDVMLRVPGWQQRVKTIYRVLAVGCCELCALRTDHDLDHIDQLYHDLDQTDHDLDQICLLYTSPSPRD